MVAHSSFAVSASQVRNTKSHKKLCSCNGRTYQEQKDLGNEGFILFMVQKCTSKVILVKRKNVQILEMDMYKKQYKYFLVI